jgi:hypothetical protein
MKGRGTILRVVDIAFRPQAADDAFTFTRL